MGRNHRPQKDLGSRDVLGAWHECGDEVGGAMMSECPGCARWGCGCEQPSEHHVIALKAKLPCGLSDRPNLRPGYRYEDTCP